MPRLSETERNALESRLVQALGKTPYKCTELSELSGGSVNFVFRGKLAQPLFRNNVASPINSVIVRHSAGFLSCNTDFLLDASRWASQHHEIHMLQELKAFEAPATADGITVKTPSLFFSDPETHMQVIEDIRGATELRAGLTSSDYNKLSSSSASIMGSAVGHWLKEFHNWISHPLRRELCAKLRKNTAMSELKFRVEYGIIFRVLENFPNILQPHKQDLTALVEFVERKSKGEESTTDEWGIIHGDFWAGNVLLRGSTSDSMTQSELYIIDWEYVQWGSHAYDLGQMIGDLYEINFFKNATSAIPALEGFVQGYGPLSEDLAFETAIHAASHMIGWYTRRDPTAPLPAPREKATEFMRIATEILVRGWRKDRIWFLDSPFACLFTENQA